MDRDPTPSAPPAQPSLAPRKKRRLLRTMALAVFGVLCLAVAAPHVLNLGFVRRKVASSLSESLQTRVELGALGFTWFTGLSLGDLKIHNPAGFAQDRPFLSLAALEGDLSMLQLLRGRLDLSGTVTGLVVRIDQDGQGRSNAEALGRRGADRPGSGPAVQIASRGGMDLSGMRLDLKVADALVEIRRGGELIESLQKLECALGKEFGSQVFRMDLKANLHRPGTPDQPGNVALRASVDAQALSFEGQLSTTGLDLSRYRPLIAAMLGEGSLTALGGIVNGTLQARGKGREGEQELFLEGNLAVQAPHLAGSLLRGMEVKAARWQLIPNLHIVPGRSGSQPTVDAARFTADLGFATMRGLPAADLQQLLGGTGLGFAFTLDLDALAAFGGPIPDSMQGNGGSVQGRLGLPIGGKLPELARLPELLRAEATMKAAQLQAFGFAFTNATAALTVKDGAFAARTGDGTLINGGPASCTVDLDLKDSKRLPFQLAVNWKGGNAGDAAVWLLRYGAPVLAGLEAGSNLTAIADLDLKLAGPALRTPGETWLQFFNVWSGSGHLTLRNTAFTPAPALRALANAIAGNAGRVTIERFGGAFSMHEGTVQSQLMKLDSKGSEYGFQGVTRLDGSLEWNVDLTPFLQQHRDGAKVAAAFGGKPIQAGITGTLDAPQLRMPDLATLLQNAAQEALKDKAGDAVQKALEELFGKRKK